MISCGMSDTATVLFDRWDATISVVRESSSFWLNFSVIGPRMTYAKQRCARKISGLDLIGKPVFRPAKKGASSVSEADLELDITGEVCPMTFVRTKLASGEMAVGQVLNIRLRDGEPRHNVPRAVRDHGHEILSLRRWTTICSSCVIRKQR